MDRVCIMRKLAAIATLSLLAAGCSTSNLTSLSGTSSDTSSSPGLTDRITDFLFTGGSRRPQQQAGQPLLPDDVDCPAVGVREGAATLALHGTGEASAMNLRYQGSIGRTARECKIVGGAVQMKVGVEGRIVLGPAGSPGKLDVPLRVAVVREGPEPHTVTTKTYRVPVVLDPTVGSVPFVLIDDALTFPMPSASELAAYIVYVGYDPDAVKRPAPRQRKTAPRRKQ
jgi:hypothetical protein